MINSPKFLEKEYFFIILAGLIYGGIIFGGNVLVNFGLSLFEISTLPFIFSVLVILPFLLFKKEHRYKRDNLLVLFIYGIVSAAGCVLEFAGIFFKVPVAIIVLLLYTQPLWTIIFSVAILKEKLFSKDILAVMLVLLGVFILVNPLTAGRIGEPLGLFFALLGGIALSGWVFVGSYLSKKGNDPINTFFSGTFISLITLAIFFPIMSFFIKDRSITGFTLTWPINIWFSLIAFSLITQVAGHLLYLVGIKKVSTINAGIILLLEPISAAVLSAIFLKQPITINIIMGGLLIILANYIVIKKPQSLKSLGL